MYKYTQLFNYDEADAVSVKICYDRSKAVMKFCCDVTKLKFDEETIAACMVLLPAGTHIIHLQRHMLFPVDCGLEDIDRDTRLVHLNF